MTLENILIGLCVALIIFGSVCRYIELYQIKRRWKK